MAVRIEKIICNIQHERTGGRRMRCMKTLFEDVVRRRCSKSRRGFAGKLVSIRRNLLVSSDEENSLLFILISA
jgi:hypothetical protein